MEAVATRKFRQSKYSQIQHKLANWEKRQPKIPARLLFSPEQLGAKFMGAYHEHECPRCRRITSGTGESLCPKCAAQNHAVLAEFTHHGSK